MKQEILNKLAKAAVTHQKVKIRYLKADGTSVTRIIAPYEFKDGYVYATDAKDKHKKVKSFIGDNIRTVVFVNLKFIPKWPINFNVGTRHGAALLVTVIVLSSIMAVGVNTIFNIILVLLCLLVTIVVVVLSIVLLMSCIFGIEIVPSDWIKKKGR